jgi:hypothetical protein
MIRFSVEGGTVWVKPEYIVSVQIGEMSGCIDIASGTRYFVTPADAERVLLALTEKEEVKS